eukprot:scaffold83298_cov27-Tisochrysis_lutea.AAC.1
MKTCVQIDNTTEALVSDLEKLRAHLGIASWLVLGGSWGVALGLAYASAHPTRASTHPVSYMCAEICAGGGAGLSIFTPHQMCACQGCASAHPAECMCAFQCVWHTSTSSSVHTASVRTCSSGSAHEA